MKPVPSQVIAGCFALSAFAVALIAGIVASNEAWTILVRALLMLIVCYPLGLLAGMVCEYIVREEVESESRDGQSSSVVGHGSAADEQIVDNEEIVTV